MFLWCQINEYTRLFGTQEYAYFLLYESYQNLHTVSFSGFNEPCCMQKKTILAHIFEILYYIYIYMLLNTSRTLDQNFKKIHL